MKEKIALLDGHSIVNRAFYGVPDLTNAEGLHTNAIYGFLQILFKIREEETPAYLAIAFDLPAPTFRHKLYQAYKGTRHPMPQELREQIPVLQEVLRAMGIPLIMQEGYEADDILGTLAKRAEADDLEVVIVSGDRDLLQLASDRIQIQIPKTTSGRTETQKFSAAEVQETYQLSPPQIIDLKALMGDSSDNIPGLPGVGIKTATTILTAYGSIEKAHEHIEEIKPNKARKAMEEHWDLAVLSKTLATIDTEVPLAIELKSLQIREWFTPEATQWFKSLEFRKWVAKGGTDSSSVAEGKRTTISERSEAEKLFAQKAGSDRIGIAVLGEFVRGVADDPVGLAMAFSDEEAVWIPLGDALSKDWIKEQMLRFTEQGSTLCVWKLKELLHFFSLPSTISFFDIHLAAYLLDPLASAYPYDRISKEYGNRSVCSQEEIFGKAKLPAVSDMTEDQRLQYATDMAYAAYSSAAGLRESLQNKGMDRLYQEIELPLVFVLTEMEKTGVRILPEELQRYGKTLQEGIKALEKKIYAAAGETFNIQSPKQLGEILFAKMQLPGGRKTKTGYSTAADVLEKLAPDVPFVADVLEYRQLAKLKSTYADGLAAYVADDGRIHTTFHQTITATGRLSSADPNLQNIPVRMDLGRQIRKVFVPREGYVFVDADYSQIELRVLASLSGDEKLIQAYQEEKDIHAITASQVFHVPFADVTPLQRRNAKAVNFGIVYGISAFGLGQDLHISQAEAAAYIENYYQTYPGIKAYLDNLVTSAKEKGYVETLYGRRRPMPELHASQFMQRQFGERVAKNAPIQGTAADIIKLAMLRVADRLTKETKDARLVLQVHDELLVEVRKEDCEQVKQILQEEMTSAAELAVPLEIDLHCGDSWYEAK